MKAKNLALCALLTALSLLLSYAESFLPLSLLVPVPGLKLGLPNLVTLAALYLLGAPLSGVCIVHALFPWRILCERPGVVLVFLCGAALSLAVMWVLKTACRRRVSIWGVSVAGAARIIWGRSARRQP